jgi:hypothetical protein
VGLDDRVAIAELADQKSIWYKIENRDWGILLFIFHPFAGDARKVVIAADRPFQLVQQNPSWCSSF